jgi:hypothetical protein
MGGVRPLGLGAVMMRDFHDRLTPRTFEIRRAGRLVILAAIAGLGAGGDEPRPSGTRRDDDGSLRGSIHLRIADPANPRRRNLRLDQDGALPLRAHDRFWLEARLNRKAYLYVFWIGSDGRVGPIYPWTSRHWDRPAREEKTDRLDLPPKTEEAWEIPAGDPGLEAVVLLAREQSPLPRDVDLAKLLVGSTAQRRPSLDKAVWIENGREVTLDPDDRTSPSTRTMPSTKTRKSDDPVLRFRRLLQDKVQPLGNYSQAVLFPNQGGE